MKAANHENLIKCNHCDAIYDKTTEWSYGYTEGTTGNFVSTGKITAGKCPVCRKEQK